VLEVIPHSDLPAEVRQMLLGAAQDGLKAALQGQAGLRPKDQLASQDERPIPRVGRNQPCPWGSGKKYKHCHGRFVR